MFKWLNTQIVKLTANTLLTRTATVKFKSSANTCSLSLLPYSFQPGSVTTVGYSLKNALSCRLLFIYMTSRHALDHFSARHSRRNIKNGFLRTSEEEIYVILSVSQRTCKNIPRTTMFSSLLWLQGMEF